VDFVFFRVLIVDHALDKLIAVSHSSDGKSRFIKKYAPELRSHCLVEVILKIAITIKQWPSLSSLSYLVAVLD